MKLEEFEKDAIESFIAKHDLTEQQIEEILDPAALTGMDKKKSR
jgi:hypothetical protein